MTARTNPAPASASTKERANEVECSTLLAQKLAQRAKQAGITTTSKNNP